MKYICSENKLEYLRITDPAFDKITHGFFTRKGGVSPVPFDSLNLSVSTGDTQENIKENRKRIFEALNKDIRSLFDVWQVHSDKVIFSNMPRISGRDLIQADAIFTNNPDITLMMRFADCVPVLIYDPIKRAIGIIHAGWQGTIKQIVRKSISQMCDQYGTITTDIVAVVGPSIGPDHYEVGRTVYELAIDLFGKNDEIIKNESGKYIFNLWEANEFQLKQSGVLNVTQTKICTACNTDRWYSHRAESGKTGRFAALLSLT